MKSAQKQAEPVRLVVFLGNPGSRYGSTRHNVGRMVVDHLPLPATPWKEKFHGLFARRGELVLLQPSTYMNESGRSVQAAAAFFDVPREAILVAQDDLETPFGTVQLTFGGGHRGNNGVRSLEQHLGGRDFWRVRIGIGRPPSNRKPADWVLERFSPDEEARLPEILIRAAELIRGKTDTFW